MAAKKTSYRLSLGATKKKSGAKRSALSPFALQNFQVREAYKLLRTNLQFYFKDKSNKMFLVTSASAAEGKSTTALNISITMADAGARICLVDLDLRRPSIHKMLQISHMPGVTNVLGGLLTLEEAVRTTQYPNLDVLSSGPIPPNPAELLGTPEMEQMLGALNDKYDFVIIDTPPIGVVADAMIVEKCTSGIVLVVREGQTTFEMVKQSKLNIDMLQGKIIGIVLNEIDFDAHYYTYNKGYKSRYQKYSYYGNERG